MRFATATTVVQLQLHITSDESRTQRTIEALRSLMAPAQLDRGCTGCGLYTDVFDPHQLYYIEEWATPADLKREICSTRFTRLLSVMEEAPAEPHLEFRFISQTRGLDYIQEVRSGNEDCQIDGEPWPC